MNMNCPVCDAINTEDAIFCHFCGRKIRVNEDQKKETQKKKNRMKKPDVELRERKKVLMLPLQKIEILTFILEYKDKIKKSKDWITPLSILITILAALITSFFEYKRSLGFSILNWIIIILSVSFCISLVFFIIVIINFCKIKKINEKKEIDDFWETYEGKRELVSENID